MDQRHYHRHLCSQQAVIRSEGRAAGFGVITNLGIGGLCVAPVGSARRWEPEEVSVTVNRHTIPCVIVQRESDGLHCSFDTSRDEQQSILMIERIQRLRHAFNQIAFVNIPVLGKEENILSDFRRRSDNLGLVYTEGCFAAREQLDTVLDALDETVEVLNPYQIPDKRERWAAGFKDSVRHRANQ